MHALVSSLKGLASWSATKGLQECRESCGGLGFSYFANLGQLRNNFDINQTWEGDNNVLLQQTSKYLLEFIQKKFKGKERQNETCGFIKVEPVEGTQCEATTEADFLKAENLLSVFEFRTNLLLQRSAMKLAAKVQGQKIEPLQAWNDTQPFLLNNLAKSYGEVFTVQRFNEYLKKTLETNVNEETKEAITLLHQLYCLTRIEADLGTFREGDFLTSDHGQMVKKQILEVCGKLKKHIVKITETFPPSEEMTDSFIAPQNGDLYGSIINKVYTAPKAFERYEQWRSLYNQK